MLEGARIWLVSAMIVVRKAVSELTELSASDTLMALVNIDRFQT